MNGNGKDCIRSAEGGKAARLMLLTLEKHDTSCRAWTTGGRRRSFIARMSALTSAQSRKVNSERTRSNRPNARALWTNGSAKINEVVQRMEQQSRDRSTYQVFGRG